jgi:hypothetical protein
MSNDHDDSMLGDLQALFARADPVPLHVTQAAKAALGWRRLEADFAEILSDSTLEEESLALVRGSGAPVRSVSFSAGELTLEVEIHADGPQRRLLGQLSPPPLAARIEIQTTDDPAVAVAEADELGRFRAQLPAAGPIRLRISSADSAWSAGVETSWITI